MPNYNLETLSKHAQAQKGWTEETRLKFLQICREHGFISADKGRETITHENFDKALELLEA